MASDIDPAGVTTSLASAAQASACLAILPEAAGVDGPLFLARHGGRLAGAAALVWRSWRDPAGFALSLRVAPAYRRRGVGRALVAAAARAASGETLGLWTPHPLSPDSAEAAFLAACGFTALRRELHFAAAIADLQANIAPLVARLRRGRTESVQWVALEDAWLEEAAWMISRNLAGGPVTAMAGLRQRQADPADHSELGLVGGRLAAAILWRVHEGEAVIDARVVAEPWRRGALGLEMLERQMRRGLELGLTAMHFHCDDNVADTIALAGRSQARLSETRAHYYLRLS